MQRGEASCLQYFDENGALVERCNDGSRVVVLAPREARSLLHAAPAAEEAASQADVSGFAPLRPLEVAAHASYGRFERSATSASSDAIQIDAIAAELSLGTLLAEEWRVGALFAFRYTRFRQPLDEWATLGVLLGAEAVRLGPPITMSGRAPVPFAGPRIGIAKDAGYLRPALGAVAGLRLPLAPEVQAETRIQVLSTLPTGHRSEEAPVRFEIGLSLGLVLSLPVLGGGA